MLRLLVALLAFTTQWRGVNCQLYYWVDASCVGKIPGVIGDAVRMAAGASIRLSHQEQNQQQLFTRIFKTQTNDANAIAQVQDVMGGIGSFRQSAQRESSDVRIYCDNDRYAPFGRWTPVPDIDGDSNPNSRRTDGVDKEYEDVVNALGRTPDTMGCLDDGTQAETYTILRTPQNTVANQNPQRSAITLCDRAFVDAANNPLPIKSFFDIDPRSDLTQRNLVDYWEALTSVDLLHELTHIRRFSKIDVPLPQLPTKPNGDPETAVGYELVVHEIQNSDDALRNADSFAQFGLFARLADFNYRLSSNPAEADDGNLDYDSGLPSPDTQLAALPLRRRRRKRAGSSPEITTSSSNYTLVANTL